MFNPETKRSSYNDASLPDCFFVTRLIPLTLATDKAKQNTRRQQKKSCALSWMTTTRHKKKLVLRTRVPSNPTTISVHFFYHAQLYTQIHVE